jgi:autotransporter-associated beta strand protein
VDISAAGGVIPDNTTANVRINSDSGTVTLAAPTTNIHTLTQNTGGVTVVDTGGGTLRLGEIGGLFLTPQSGDLTIGTTPNQGFLRAGGNVDGVAGEIVVGNFSGSSLTINSVIENNAGGIVSLTKTGSGAVTLAGTNTYTGLTTVNEGTLNLNATAGTNAINGNVFVNGGTIRLQQSDQIVDAAIVTVAAGSLEIGGNNETVGGVVLSGGAINGSGGTLTSGTNYNVQSGSIGAILGGAVGLDKTTEGTVVLTGQNTYSGATTINAGTLRTDASLVISTASAVTVNAGGTLDINDSVQSVGSIAGAGSIVLGYGELRTGSDNTSTTFSGVIQGYPDVPTIFGTQPGGSLTKLGAGVLTLSNQNLYSGTTTVSA